MGQCLHCCMLLRQKIKVCAVGNFLLLICNFTEDTAESGSSQRNGVLKAREKYRQPLVASCQFMSDSLLYLRNIIVGKQPLFPS